MTPSPNTVHLNAGGGGVRVKSYTPLIVPGHKSQYHDQRMRTTSGSSSMEKSSQEFYAGAKFDFSPSVASLPTPPTNWTIPLIRSQSQPSSPVTTSMTNNHHQQQLNGSSIITKKIDVNSLFLTPQSNKVVKASSFEMVNGSSTVNNEKMFEKEQRLETQNKMKKKTVDKFSQSRNRNWNEKDALKSNQKSATVTTTTVYNNSNTKNTSNATTTTTIPNNKMNTPKNYHHHQQQQQKYYHSSSSSSPRSVIQVVETKQKQMMYPQLTEHLRGLLKVQG
jgi:hypothetical protein